MREQLYPCPRVLLVQHQLELLLLRAGSSASARHRRLRSRRSSISAGGLNEKLELENDEDGLDLLSLLGLSVLAIGVSSADLRPWCDGSTRSSMPTMRRTMRRTTMMAWTRSSRSTMAWSFWTTDGLLYLSLVGLLAPAVLGISRTAAWGSGPRPHQPTIGASF